MFFLSRLVSGVQLESDMTHRFELAVFKFLKWADELTLNIRYIKN